MIKDEFFIKSTALLKIFAISPHDISQFEKTIFFQRKNQFRFINCTCELLLKTIFGFIENKFMF